MDLSKIFYTRLFTHVNDFPTPQYIIGRVDTADYSNLAAGVIGGLIGAPVRVGADPKTWGGKKDGPIMDIPSLGYALIYPGYYIAKHSSGCFAVLTAAEWATIIERSGDMPRGGSGKTMYVSGPMTGYENANIPAFIKAELLHLALGYAVLSPAHNQKSSGMTWEDYMRLALKQLCASDAIHMLKGWERSRGALIEHSIACALSMPVTYE